MAKKASRRRADHSVTEPAADPTAEDYAAALPDTGGLPPMSPSASEPAATGAEATLREVLAMREATKEARAEAMEEIASKYQFYLKCPACLKPAIFFTEDPRGKSLIEAHHWRSVYHDENEPYFYTYVFCQQDWIDCFNEKTGESRNSFRLPMAIVRQGNKIGFKITQPRWIAAFDRSQSAPAAEQPTVPTGTASEAF